MPSASLATSVDLLELRNRIIRGVARDEHEHGMQRYRRDIEDLGPGAAHARVVQVFLNLWSYLSTIPDKNPWNLPPLYLDDSLTSLMESAVQSLWLREKGHVHGSTDNVGHMVLGGIKGTGKTTLLRALSIGVAVLFSRMLPITHTYDAERCDSSPVAMLTTALSAAASAAGGDTALAAGAGSAPPRTTVEEALGQLRTAAGTLDIDVFLVLDEFQFVFDAGSPANLPLRVTAAADVAAISRLGGTFVLITGCSGDLRTRLFRSFVDGKIDQWRAAGFPDFNGSLYEIFNAPALRTPEALAAFIACRYPRWALSDEDVRVLLAHTGGIAGVVHRAWQVMLTTVEAGARVLGVAAAEAAFSADSSQLRRIRPEFAFDTRSDVRAVMTQFVLRFSSEIHGDAASPRRLLPCLTLPATAVAAALRAAGFSQPTGIINELVDLSLLYLPQTRGGPRSGDRQVQIARPVDVHAYYGSESARRRNLLLLMAVQCMVHGIRGETGEHADDDLAHVNAGNALEQLIRPRVRDLILPGAAARPSFTGRCITISGDHLKVSPTGSGAMQILSVELLDELEGTLLVWKREAGLYGVVLRRIRSDRWVLYGWQSKGGQLESTIGGGQLSTSISRYVEDGTVGGLDDSYLHGILVKAQVGMCQLLTAWHATLPGISLLPGGLTLTTTKKADLAKAEVGSMSSRMSIDGGVARVAGLPQDAAWVPGVLAARIELVVHDGLQ